MIDGMLPVLVLVGRPNVGKSTLFNQLTRSRDALVADQPGLTRDRQYGLGRVGEFRYLVVDTGGLSGTSVEMEVAMARQTRLAIAEADLVLLLVDARAGRTAQDEVIAQELRSLGCPVCLVANKVDGLDIDTALTEFHALGLGSVYPISAAHGRGLSALMTTVRERWWPSTLSADERTGGGGGRQDKVLSRSARTLQDAWIERQPPQPQGTQPTVALEADGSVPGQEPGQEITPATTLTILPGGAPDALETPPEAEAGPEGNPPPAHWQWPGIRVAVVGRPNVGKSTLINRILGEERLLATPLAGTTRDRIFVPFVRDGQDYTLIDTAGVRRRARVHDMIEKFSIIKTLQAIAEAQVVLLVLDAQAGISDQDAHLLGLVLEAGRALVLVVNKWDGLETAQRERIREELERQLSFVRFARMRFVSARHGTNVGHLFADIREAHASATLSLSTPRLTRLLETAVAENPPPRVGLRRIKLRYAHQGGQNPPVIVIHGNQTESLPLNYQRYLENYFRSQIGLVGSPLRLEFKTSTNPFAGRRNVLTDRQKRQRQRLMRHVRKNK